MHNYHRDRGPPRCAFKVDIQKASVKEGYVKVILFLLIFFTLVMEEILSLSLKYIPKSMAFFCNVVPHVKNVILSIMPFSEVLVERARNRIGDWKNKSLPFAGRLQLSYKGLLVVLMVIISVIKRKFAWDDIFFRNLKVAWFTPNIDISRHDSMRWCDLNGNLSDFSVKCAWRHAFHIWLVMRRCLKTQYKLRPWDVDAQTDVSQLRCSLCGSQQDSHEHLFFECSYSSKVWNYIRNLAGMEHVPPVLDDIAMWFIRCKYIRLF
ncbi:RNA-directed DNA polymerase, eukaryota [Tanacetum coccineum]